MPEGFSETVVFGEDDARLEGASLLEIHERIGYDYDRIAQGQNLDLKNIDSGMASGTVTAVIRETGEEILLGCHFTQRQMGILKAGGLLNYTKECNE